MGIAITLKEYLTDHTVEYEAIEHARTSSTLQSSEVAHVMGDQMVKSVLLGDGESYLMALIPATHRLDVSDLNKSLGRELKLMSEEEVAGAFADCETGSIPPFGEAYGIETWVEQSLFKQPEVFFESGDHGVLIRMDGGKFRELMSNAPLTHMSHHI